MSASTTDAATVTDLHAGSDKPSRTARRAAKRVARSDAADVVTSVAEQTAAAEALARINGQERLADPATNPAVRAHADKLRDAEHRQELSARHSRMSRHLRVEDRRAENAEKALELIYSARRMNSPAESVLALHKGRRLFLGVAQAASLALSVGSATGPAAIATKYHTWSGVGYIAEIGLTGLTTMAVLYRAHISTHGGYRASDRRDWRTAVIWLLMILPLTASIVANAVTHGAVGVFCSVGAAAFSLFSYVISDLSSDALARRAAEVTGADEALLRAVATGGVPADVAAPVPPVKTTRPKVKVERAPEPKPEITEDKKLELETGQPKATPIRLREPQNHPKWQRGVDVFTASLDAGTELPLRRLAEEMGMKNRNLATQVRNHVKAQRNGALS